MSTETIEGIVAEMRERAFVHGERGIATDIVKWSDRLEALGRRSDAPTTCEGCPHLRTKKWRDELDNDETDSGTSAACAMAEGRWIDSYWRAHHKPPTWCPRSTAAAQRQEQEGPNNG